MVSKKTVVLINLVKRGSDKPSNVVIRGVGDLGLAIRPPVKTTEGGMFAPGTSEIIAGTSVARQFNGAGIGETLRFGQRDWTVVGVFDAHGSALDSAIWGDVEHLIEAVRRASYSTVIARLDNDEALARLTDALENDPRLT